MYTVWSGLKNEINYHSNSIVVGSVRIEWATSWILDSMEPKMVMSPAKLNACQLANKRATCKFDTILNKTIMEMLVIKYPAFEVVVIVPDQVVAHPLCTHFRGLIRSIAQNPFIQSSEWTGWCLGECAPNTKPKVHCVKCRIVSTHHRKTRDSVFSFIHWSRKRRRPGATSKHEIGPTRKERHVKISFVHIILFQMFTKFDTHRLERNKSTKAQEKHQILMHYQKHNKNKMKFAQTHTNIYSFTWTETQSPSE